VAPTLVRVAAEVIRTVRDAHSRARSDLPRHLDSVDAAWLARFTDRRITAVEVLGRDSGTTTRARVKLTGDDRVPATVFVKLAPTERRTRIFVNLMGLGRQEVAFYNRVRASVPVTTPRPLGARYDPRLARFALVLEDLGARGYTFGDITDPCTPDQAHSVVTELARLHAEFWESPRLRGDLAWVHTQPRDPNAALVARLIRRSVRQVDERFAHLVPENVRRDSRVVVERRAELDVRLWLAPNTLLHGDTHLGNMAFAGNDPVFFDWQVMRQGPGMRDVAYFLITSLAAEVRDAHQRDLVRAYLDGLRAGGVEVPFEEAWYRYRLHAVDPWIASVVTVAAGGLQPAAVATLGLERSVEAVQDLETFQAVRGLLD